MIFIIFGDRPALPAPDPLAAGPAGTAAAGRLDGDPQAGAGLPGLRHRRVADLGAGAAGRAAR